MWLLVNTLPVTQNLAPHPNFRIHDHCYGYGYGSKLGVIDFRIPLLAV